MTCQNGNCVPSRWICDNYNDCFDNSDEKQCGDYTYFSYFQMMSLNFDLIHVLSLTGGQIFFFYCTRPTLVRCLKKYIFSCRTKVPNNVVA